ncbi:MAG: hypothetical protein P8106_07250 [Gammaproteobacteria bacterium]|jgi:hypothetical protein
MPRSATRQSKKTPAALNSAALSDVTDWDSDADSNTDCAPVEWMDLAARDKETSRIRRQMEARRKLEKRLEEKRLRDLVEDWAFDAEY